MRALAEKDYLITMIACQMHSHYMNAPFDVFYPRWGKLKGFKTDIEKAVDPWNRFLSEAGNLPELLTLSTPLSIISNSLIVLPENVDWQPLTSHIPLLDEEMDIFSYPTLGYISEWRLYNALIDSSSIPSPKFVFIVNLFARAIYWYLHDSDKPVGDFSRVDLYLDAYEYAVLSMLNKVDIILEQNPDSVIVLQSDHGIINNESLEQMRIWGYTENDIRDARMVVFSAVRIPPQYGGVDEPIAPLNISRELVNRFVGENYVLLPSD